MRKQGTPTSQVKRFGHLRMWDRDRSNQRATLTNIGPQFQASWATARTSDGSTLDPLSSPLSCMSLPFNSTAKRSGWMRPQSRYTSPTSRIYYERHYHRAAGQNFTFNSKGGILLGHESVRTTERNYAPWVRSRQKQLEADLTRAWNLGPVIAAQIPQARGTRWYTRKSSVLTHTF